jgi:GT2 family glycosyltransferase
MAPPRDVAVDVVVPVYNQREMVEPCLASILQARNDTPYELVVIDDGSTDDGLKAALATLAAEGRITLLANERNIGFTGTVNRGMRLHPGRDVILLNSDTLVFGNWIDRLRRAALSGPRIATANPLTNASHIGAYPFRHPDGQARFEIGDAELDALAASIRPVRRVAVHLTVGFCQYIRRAAIEEIGVFDAENFPLGYGEESDFCYRARRLGWRHVVTGDAFVRHWEGQSFGERKAQLMVRMIETFNRLHPDLGANDLDFAARDPIRPLRETLDLARLKRLLRGAAKLPCLDEAGAARATGPVLVLGTQAPLLRLLAPGVPTLASLPTFALPADVAALNTTLARLGIRAIGFDGAALRGRFAALVRGRPGEVTVEAAMESAGQAA